MEVERGEPNHYVPLARSASCLDRIFAQLPGWATYSLIVKARPVEVPTVSYKHGARGHSRASLLIESRALRRGHDPPSPELLPRTRFSA